jgi:hypothetical protein
VTTKRTTGSAFPTGEGDEFVHGRVRDARQRRMARFVGGTSRPGVLADDEHREQPRPRPPARIPAGAMDTLPRAPSAEDELRRLLAEPGLHRGWRTLG